MERKEISNQKQLQVTHHKLQDMTQVTTQILSLILDMDFNKSGHTICSVVMMQGCNITFQMIIRCNLKINLFLFQKDWKMDSKIFRIQISFLQICSKSMWNMLDTQYFQSSVRKHVKSWKNFILLFEKTQFHQVNNFLWLVECLTQS